MYMSEVPHLEIRDVDGRSLRFTAVRRTPHELIYLAAVEVGWAQAIAEVSTYVNGPPGPFFASLAEAWRGWNAERKWEDLEYRLAFTATCDRTGHVVLSVAVQDSHYSGRVQVQLHLEAGSLEGIARRVEAFFAAAELMPINR
jgi:hypothetical protein